MFECPWCPTTRNLEQNLHDHVVVMHPKERNNYRREMDQRRIDSALADIDANP